MILVTPQLMSSTPQPQSSDTVTSTGVDQPTSTGVDQPTSTGVGQPLTTPSAEQPVAGTQIGVGTTGGAGGFGGATQPAGAVGGVPSTSTLPPGAAQPSTTPPGTIGAVQAPPQPVLIPAPTSSTTAPVASAMTAATPPDAVGVVVESMMLADVVGVDTERGCMTVRALNGDRASYRIENPADPKVAVGDDVVIEAARPLFASTGDAPSASPRMVEPKAPVRGGISSPRSATQGEKRTISTAARPTVISRDAVRCPSR
jgi:hypothetical protein